MWPLWVLLGFLALLAVLVFSSWYDPDEPQ